MATNKSKPTASTAASAAEATPPLAAVPGPEMVRVVFTGVIVGEHVVPKGTKLSELQPDLASVVLRDASGNSIAHDAVLNDALLAVTTTASEAQAPGGARTAKVATASKSSRG